MTNWDGTISKAMFDLSSVQTSYDTFTNLTKQYLLNCLIGNAHLTGEGSLNEHWEEIVEEAVERGEIALIELTKGNRYLAIPKLLKQTLLKAKVKGEKEGETIEPIISYEFTLLENSDLVYHSEDVSKWVIFKWNREGTKPLTGLDFWTKRLINLLTKHEQDLILSEKGIMVTLPSWPADSDVDLIMKSFSKKPFFFMCLPQSQKGDPKEGKLGIAPHQIKTEIYEPKTDQRAFIIRDFKWIWTQMERAYGIRHDTLQEKDERASVSEVFSSQANFDAFERKVYRSLLKGIREYNRVFEEGKGSYAFKYGRIGG